MNARRALAAVLITLSLAVRPGGAARGEEAPAASPRLASSSLCADLYVAAVARPEAVAAISWQADDPISSTPAVLRARPRAWDSAERLLTLDASLIVTGPGAPLRRADLFERFGRRVLTLSWTEDFDGVRANLRAVGEAAQRPARAEWVIDDLDARLAELQTRTQARGALTKAKAASVLYLTPTGGAAGAGTFVDAAITAAGGRNAAAAFGVAGWGRLGVEAVVSLNPDLVATSFFEPGYHSVADRARRSSIYRRLLAERPRAAQVEIPAGLWPCAAPTLIDAAESIADALDRLDPQTP